VAQLFSLGLLANAMKTQLLREHHSRQDKTRKPDYREEIVERGRSEQTTTESSRLLGRVSARENLVQSIRSFRFVYRGMSYKFGWNLEVFARKNDLPAGDDTTKAAMEMVQQAAERDVSAFAERIMTAAIRKQGVFYHFDYEAPKTECQML
jgi:hypothetical protein